MNSALIGHTGFVGGNLLDQHAFAHGFNSKNFRDMTGQRFDELVCAGVSAVKWIANREPEQDRENIRQLEDVLSTVTAQRFILVSTVDVYPDTSGKDEMFDCASAPNNAYGTHRLEFERFCSQRFDNCYIVRLPGLFGRGLKKNVIYDLLNHNCLDMINPASSFQYYYLANLWRDIETAIAHDLRLVNLFTEPVTTQTIIDRFFSGEPLEGLAARPVAEAHYALKTRYADIWHGSDGYIASAGKVLDQLAGFIRQSRETAEPK